MDRIEYLLGKVAEKASEIAQRALKAQQFGLDEVQPGQEWDNAQRLGQEIRDLLITLEALDEEPSATAVRIKIDPSERDAKRAKMDKYAQLSRDLGHLDDRLNLAPVEAVAPQPASEALFESLREERQRLRDARIPDGSLILVPSLTTGGWDRACNCGQKFTTNDRFDFECSRCSIPF